MMKNVLVWVAAISIAIVSGSAALGAIAKNKSPELAVSLLPENGFALQVLISSAIMSDVVENQGNFPDSIDNAWISTAVQAFNSEAISPNAVAAIALAQDKEARLKLMRKAFELSRRQKIATGWLIADSGKRDELSALLEYYDTLLRTSTSATRSIMPVMASALADDNLIEPLTGLLSDDPPWTLRFWRQVSSTPQALGNAVQLRKRLYRSGEASENFADAELVKALIKNEQFREANELYTFLSPEYSSSSLIKNGSFSYEPRFPPLDWQLYTTGEYGAAVSDDNLQISAIAESGGRFARQLVEFPSGVLEIETKFASTIPDDANLELKISCAETLCSTAASCTIEVD